MGFKFYEWERRRYEKDADGRWVEVRGEREVRYITERWLEEKTGRVESAFWSGIGATFDVERDEFGVPIGVTSVSPCGSRKFEERFFAHFIADDGLGCREEEALRESDDLRVIPVPEDTPDHIVLQFGVETKAEYDLMTGKWVG